MDIKIENEEMKYGVLTFKNDIQKGERKSSSSDFQGIKLEEEETKCENWVTFNNEIYFKEEDFWPEEKVDCDGSSLCSFSEEKVSRNKENVTQPTIISNIGNHNSNKLEIEHVKVQRKKNRPYHCDTCEGYFNRKYKLINHEASVHGKEKPFKCTEPECDYSCSQNRNLKLHVKSIHRKEKPFKCQECDNSFSQKSNLVYHVKSVHRKEKTFKCTECDYSCCKNGDLVKHVKSVHWKEKPFKCPECANSFSQKGSLVKHVKFVHKKKKTFKCSDCDHIFSQKVHLIKHIGSKHI